MTDRHTDRCIVYETIKRKISHAVRVVVWLQTQHLLKVLINAEPVTRRRYRPKNELSQSSATVKGPLAASASCRQAGRQAAATAADTVTHS
jgi:hypothetical protein